MSNFVPQPLFPVGSWVRNKDPEWPQTPWQVQEHLRADDHDGYCCALTRSGRGRRERGFAPEYMLTLATPESASAYFAPYRPAAAVAEDHARKQEQDERVGFFGVDRSAPSLLPGLAAWLPNSAAPSVLAGTTTCATCGKVHGLLCALAIDRILKKQALEDAEPKTSLLCSEPPPDLLKELIASSLHFNPADFRAAAERAAARRREADLRCPSFHCDRPVNRLDSGMYFCPSCSWHGASLTAPVVPRFAVGDRVRQSNDTEGAMRGVAWQVVAVRQSHGDPARYDIVREALDGDDRGLDVGERHLVACEAV